MTQCIDATPRARAAWAVAAVLFATQVREAPPPPLQLTQRSIVSISRRGSALAVRIALMLTKRIREQGRLRPLRKPRPKLIRRKRHKKRRKRKRKIFHASSLRMVIAASGMLVNFRMLWWLVLSLRTSPAEMVLMSLFPLPALPTIAGTPRPLEMLCQRSRRSRKQLTVAERI